MMKGLPRIPSRISLWYSTDHCHRQYGITYPYKSPLLSSILGGKWKITEAMYTYRENNMIFLKRQSNHLAVAHWRLRKKSKNDHAIHILPIRITHISNQKFYINRVTTILNNRNRVKAKKHQGKWRSPSSLLL